MYGIVSYVSQSAWIQNKSLRDNILFGSKFDQERYDKVIFSCALNTDIKLLKSGDLTEIGEKGVNLSGGQQQRAAVARALVQGARILLADEPVASLDPESARRVMYLLKQLNQQNGMTLVVSLHNVAMARQYCSRIVALRAGAVVFDGPPSDLTDTDLRDLYGSHSEELLLDDAHRMPVPAPRDTPLPA